MGTRPVDIFNFIEKRRDDAIDEVARDLKGLVVKPASEFIDAARHGGRRHQLRRVRRSRQSHHRARQQLESGSGESGLAKTGNNLFGIKADSRWRGETLTLSTKEFIKGQWVVVPASGASTASWQASVDDHAVFLKQNQRYTPCFSCLTAEAFVRALAKAGYAADPLYADKVIGLIKQAQPADLGRRSRSELVQPILVGQLVARSSMHGLLLAGIARAECGWGSRRVQKAWDAEKSENDSSGAGQVTSSIVSRRSSSVSNLKSRGQISRVTFSEKSKAAG
jgi:hypothetical protein